MSFTHNTLHFFHHPWPKRPCYFLLLTNTLFFFLASEISSSPNYMTPFGKQKADFSTWEKTTFSFNYFKLPCHLKILKPLSWAVIHASHQDAALQVCMPNQCVWGYVLPAFSSSQRMPWTTAGGSRSLGPHHCHGKPRPSPGSRFGLAQP